MGTKQKNNPKPPRTKKFLKGPHGFWQSSVTQTTAEQSTFDFVGNNQDQHTKNSSVGNLPKLPKNTSDSNYSMIFLFLCAYYAPQMSRFYIILSLTLKALLRLVGGAKEQLIGEVELSLPRFLISLQTTNVREQIS